MKLIVLDRDGVININRKGPVVSAKQWLPIDGSLEAIARLHQAGYQVAVSTNQSGIALELLTIEDLHAIHAKMHALVNAAGGKIDAIVFCPHSDSNQCDCRKPAPGMLYTLSERLGVDLSGVPVVGDSLRDIQAAMAAAAQPILVKTGNGQDTIDNHKGLEHVPAYENLAEYVTELLATDAENT